MILTAGRASDARCAAGAAVGGVLEGDVEGLEAIRAPGHAGGRGDEPVREAGVLGQQRPVQVGPDYGAAADALLAGAARVAVPGQHTAQGPPAVAQIGAAAMVLEAGQDL